MIKYFKKILSSNYETGCIIWGKTPPKFTISSKKGNFFEKLYQDLLGVARMLHHKNAPRVDCELLAVQT